MGGSFLEILDECLSEPLDVARGERLVFHQGAALFQSGPDDGLDLFFELAVPGPGLLALARHLHVFVDVVGLVVVDVSLLLQLLSRYEQSVIQQLQLTGQ